MAVGIAERNGLTDRLLQALGRDEFILYRQSIIPLGVEGADRPFQEVLIRFREEEDKLLPPGTFLPVLEKHGLMRLLDRWVVGRVTRTVRESLEQGPVRTIPRFSINLSADTLYDARFVAHVRDAVRSAPLPESTLSFEVTQDTALAHRVALGELAASLRSSGCRFVIARYDGSEQASALVSAIDPELVKICPRLVRALEQRAAGAAAVQMIAGRCRAIGVQTIAEHVENRNTLEPLRAAGVDYAQGFGIELPECLT